MLLYIYCVLKSHGVVFNVCAAGWFSSYVFFSVVSILTPSQCCMHTFTCVSRVCIASLLLLSAPRASLLLLLLCCVCAGTTLAPFASSYFFSPKQIIFLHLIKDVSRRLSGICRLSPILLQFSLPCYVFSFLSIQCVCLQFNCISPLVQNLESALWKK